MIQLRDAIAAAWLFRFFPADPATLNDAAVVAWYRQAIAQRAAGDPQAVAFFRSFPQFKAIYLPRPGGGLVRDPGQVIGAGEHRAGWRTAVAALARHRWPLIVDDFVEHSFVYYTRPPVYSRPWVGFFHHPHKMPDFAEAKMRPQNFIQRREFRESLPFLKCAFALSEYLAAYLREALPGVPVAVVKHPTDTTAPRWKWPGNRVDLIQVGYYLRNVAAIYQVPPRGHYVRKRLRPREKPWVDAWEGGCFRHWAERGGRDSFPGVEDVPTVDHAAYDRLLASSVVLTEVFDASANNVVVECAARCTPLVVNRHPAIVEYLGASYPLFFDDIREVPDLVNPGRIQAASDYLAAMDRDWLEPAKFAADVAAAVKALGVAQ